MGVGHKPNVIVISDNAEPEFARVIGMYPWVCGRCMREFTHTNASQLTVHHRDHNHDNNPPDGSNWELLCLYCHDNEHSRYQPVLRFTQPVAAQVQATILFDRYPPHA
jgi:hypothetical protein